MNIPLGEFEQYVKPEPLERGLVLFERGQVESIRNLGKGVVEAVVHEGNALWHPQIKIQQEVAVDAACECGEALETICRHGLALIFALQSGDFPEGITTRSGKPPKEKQPAKGRGRPKLEESEPVSKPAKASAPKKPKVPKTPADILAIVPHEELVGFVLAECNADKDFAIRLKAHFADLMPAATPTEIKKRIQEMVKAAIIVKGKTKKLNEAQLSERIREWLKEGERFAEIHEYPLSFAVAEHLYAELSDLFRQNAFATENLLALESRAKELMLQLAQHPLPEPIRQAFIQNAKESWEKHFHWISPAILLASKICKAGEEYEAIEKMLATVLRNYNEAHIAHHWEMVKRVKGTEAGEAFRKNHADKAYFIRTEIQAAMAAHDYDAAIKAARRGQMRYQSYHADKTYWMEQVDAIFEAKGDHEARIELAISAHNQNITTDRVSLRNIAQLGGKGRWVVERTRLADMIAVRTHPDPNQLAFLFSLDNDWEGMVEFLKRYKVGRIAILGKVLIKEAPEKYFELLESQLEEGLKAKSRMSEWDIGQVAGVMIRCAGKERTEVFFKQLAQRLPHSHSLATFMNNLERNLSYHSNPYW
jgi:hypothetical protein